MEPLRKGFLDQVYCLSLVHVLILKGSLLEVPLLEVLPCLFTNKNIPKGYFRFY